MSRKPRARRGWRAWRLRPDDEFGLGDVARYGLLLNVMGAFLVMILAAAREGRPLFEPVVLVALGLVTLGSWLAVFEAWRAVEGVRRQRRVQREGHRQVVAGLIRRPSREPRRPPTDLWDSWVDGYRTRGPD